MLFGAASPDLRSARRDALPRPALPPRLAQRAEYHLSLAALVRLVVVNVVHNGAESAPALLVLFERRRREGRRWAATELTQSSTLWTS